MTKLRKHLTGLLLLALVAFTFSCDNNDELVPDQPADVTLTVDQAGQANPNENVTVDPVAQNEIIADVHFKATDDMTRLYITQNIGGKGEEIYKPEESKIDLKGDGSVDLTGKNANDFTYQFALPVPSGFGANGTVVYKFWVTSGVGDFRDITKRLIGTAGTITLKYGTATNPVAKVKSYQDVKLYAPAGEGTSLSFISLLDGKVYKISQGAEYISYWDFGYINLSDGGPALHSTSSYPIAALEAITETKNITHFRHSDLTVDQFNAVDVSADLSFITTPTDTFAKTLQPGHVLEFVDEYGKKGLIHVQSTMPGNDPANYITIDVKVQP